MTTPSPDDPRITPLPAQPAPEPQELQPERPAFKVIFPRRQPIVTYAIIAITVIVFLLQKGSELIPPDYIDVVASLGAKHNAAIDAGQYWRLITPVFLHGSVIHIGFNMYALYILGGQLEVFYGHGRFLSLYLLGGFSGVVASYLLNIYPSYGASTATFGLLAAYGILGFRNQKIFGVRSRLIVRNAVQVIVINLLIGLTPGIDNWGHLGGALGGLALAWFGGPVLDVERRGLELHIRDTRTPEMFAAAFAVVFVAAGALVVLG